MSNNNKINVKVVLESVHLSLSADFIRYSAVFFFYNKSTNTTFQIWLRPCLVPKSEKFSVL